MSVNPDFQYDEGMDPYDPTVNEPQRPLDPTVEQFVGYNFPYRGQATHGVDPSLFGSSDVPDEEWEGGQYELADDGEPEPAPTPVRIVNEATVEIKQWRSGQLSVGLNAMRLVGRNPDRTSLKLKNLSTNKGIYVGRDTVSYLSGYLIAPGGEFSLNSTEDVWAVAVALEDTTNNPILVAIVEEFSVEVK